MIYSIDVHITVAVNDTEVTDRVGDAVENLFPQAEFEYHDSRLTAETHSLDAFSDRLYEQEILDTARREFSGNSHPDGFSFALKKQAAFADVINFSVGNPDELGDIEVEVTVREPDIEEFVNHIAPPTEDGQPIDPTDT
jgi:Uncharacterized protein conserved in archaea